MKKNYIFWFCFALGVWRAEGQSTRATFSTQTLKGLHHIVLGEGNVNAISYAEGILFFATQLGVELYYNNQIIATFTYPELTGKTSNNRDEAVYLYPDTATHSMWVKDSKGYGRIDYFKGACVHSEQPGNAIKNRSDPYACTMLPGRQVRHGDRVFALPSTGDSLTCAVYNGFKSNTTQDIILAGTLNHGLLQYSFDKKGACTRIDSLVIPISGQAPVRHIMSLKYLPEFETVVIGTCGPGAFLWSQRREMVFKPAKTPAPADEDFRSFARVDGEHVLAGDDQGSVSLYQMEANGPEWLCSLTVAELNQPARVTAIVST